MDHLPRIRISPKLRRRLPTILALILSAAFGLITRLFVGQDFLPLGSISLSFFVAVPVLLGFLTVALAPPEEASTWRFSIFGPWIPTLAGMAIAAAFYLEAWFCIALASPAFLALSSIGGIVTRLIRSKVGNFKPPFILLVVLIPYIASPLEAGLPGRTRIRRVHSEIRVEAPADLVWSQITSIPEIQEKERPSSIFPLLGLPRPIQASMACEEDGCIRTGEWESGLVFEGTITHVSQGREYWVTLTADTSGVVSSPAPLGDIGGPTFEMIDDGYVVEPLESDVSVLHLYSTYRITSPINAYASVWLDFLLRDIQMHLLRIEKARSEQAFE